MKGLARGMCFLGTAIMITAWNGNLPLWIAPIVAFIVGGCAHYGWE